jgi:pilus assembly protein CpaC
MAAKRIKGAALGAAIAVAALSVAAPPAFAQVVVSSGDELRAGELQVPVNKSQVLRIDRPYAKALLGNPDIADILPLTDSSLYVLGKKTGTTSLTLYDRRNMLIAVVDIAVGPDVVSLKQQLSQLMPGDQVGARIANDSLVLEGIVSSGPAADRAVQLAETYAPGKVINLMQIGSAQQVMLEVKFSEIKRSALKDLGFGFFVRGSGNNGFQGAIGSGASLTPGTDGEGVLGLGSFADKFGVLTRRFSILGLSLDAAMAALESKGAVTTLAEPTLVALSGETASFLAGGEFPIPVAQGGGGSSTGGDGGTVGNVGISVQFKSFGVSLGFTPTVLADGVINLEVAPEVSSIDRSASVVINGLAIPGLQTRRAKTTVELRDGESFAMAGLLRRDFQDTVRQFPILGSIPIIGTLFRSSGFQKEETELVIIVTPRLVRPVPARAMKLPTDRVRAPDEVDLFLLGRTDTGVGVNPLAPTQASPAGRPIGEMPPAPQPTYVPPRPAPAPAGGGGMAVLDPTKLEKDYGHAL